MNTKLTALSQAAGGLRFFAKSLRTRRQPQTDYQASGLYNVLRGGMFQRDACTFVCITSIRAFQRSSEARDRRVDSGTARDSVLRAATPSQSSWRSYGVLYPREGALIDDSCTYQQLFSGDGVVGVCNNLTDRQAGFLRTVHELARDEQTNGSNQLIVSRLDAPMNRRLRQKSIDKVHRQREDSSVAEVFVADLSITSHSMRKY